MRAMVLNGTKVRLWPAWKCAFQPCRTSHPGTPTCPSLVAPRWLATTKSRVRVPDVTVLYTALSALIVSCPFLTHITPRTFPHYHYRRPLPLPLGRLHRQIWRGPQGTFHPPGRPHIASFPATPIPSTHPTPPRHTPSHPTPSHLTPPYPTPPPTGPGDAVLLRLWRRFFHGLHRRPFRHGPHPPHEPGNAIQPPVFRLPFLPVRCPLPCRRRRRRRRLYRCCSILHLAL